MKDMQETSEADGIQWDRSFDVGWHWTVRNASTARVWTLYESTRNPLNARA